MSGRSISGNRVVDYPDSCRADRTAGNRPAHLGIDSSVGRIAGKRGEETL